MKTKVIIILVIVGVCGIFGYDYLIKNRTRELKLYGNVEIRQVNLGFQVSGELSDMKFEEGDRVKAGELLAAIDSKPYKIKLEQARAQLQQSKVALDNANIYFKRNINLCRKNTISKQQCDDIKAKKDEASAMYDYSKTMVDQAQLSLDYTKIYSPSDGIIITRINEKGTILGAGSPVYTLSLNDKMWVRTFIEEPYLGKVKLGTKVKIKTDSSGKTYEGQIGFISSTAEFTPKNIETPSLRTDLVYRTKIIVTNADDFLKQGMPVTIVLE